MSWSSLHEIHLFLFFIADPGQDIKMVCVLHMYECAVLVCVAPKCLERDFNIIPYRGTLQCY